ncbi:hypothetical protein ZWY2020_033179 [Hordeum vulgare]|nr:hypothetical protein ZWY2020_033179 [Hordeum vulgare]
MEGQTGPSGPCHNMALFNLETEEWMGIVQGRMPVSRFVKDSNGRCGYFSLYLELSLRAPSLLRLNVALPVVAISP